MPEFPPLRDAWFLTGPTAAGKSEVAVELAERQGCEIISLDSMAVYRQLDIGTAKPSAAQRQRVAHHLIDVVDPWDEFSLADYIERAHRAAREIRARGRRPLLVGGTPLYLKALLRGFLDAPPGDAKLRAELEQQAATHDPQWLWQQVQSVDPAAAARLHPHDRRRLIRALEVHATSGRAISELQRQFDRPAEPPLTALVLDWPREELYRRINARVEQMFAQGLVDEVQHVLARGRTLSPTARQALGYREVLACLAQELPGDELVSQVQQHTRQFARRQLIWFRGLAECRFVPCDQTTRIDQLVDRLERQLPDR